MIIDDYCWIVEKLVVTYTFFQYINNYIPNNNTLKAFFEHFLIVHYCKIKIKIVSITKR